MAEANKEERILYELTTISLLLDQMTDTLASIKQLTLPGGEFHDNQQALVQSLQVWQHLFAAKK